MGICPYRSNLVKAPPRRSPRGARKQYFAPDSTRSRPGLSWLVPAVHVVGASGRGMDGRDNPGHDDFWVAAVPEAPQHALASALRISSEPIAKQSEIRCRA